MQRWHDELAKHPINTTIKQFDKAAEYEINIDDPILEIERVRFTKFHHLLTETIKKIEPDLAPIDLLNQLHSQFQSQGAVNTINNLINGNDPNLFRQLNDQITPSLSYLMQLRAAVVGFDTKEADSVAATSGFESFAKSISKKQKESESFIGKASSKISEAEEKIKSLSEKAEVTSSTIEEKLTQWINDSSKAVTDGENKFSNAITNIRNKSEKELQEFFSKQEAEANDRKKQVSETLSSIISDSEEKLARINELYKLVARDSITGGHKEIAVREYDAAVAWRRLTMASIFVTAIWLAYSFFYVEAVIEPQRVFWLQIGKSLSLTAIFISFAVYASKQAALHRTNERRARSFFLQVQAFDPFVKDLPDEKKIELKQELITRIFGADETEHEKSMIENDGFRSMDRAFSFMERAKKLFGK